MQIEMVQLQVHQYFSFPFLDYVPISNWTWLHTLHEFVPVLHTVTYKQKKEELFLHSPSFVRSDYHCSSCIFLFHIHVHTQSSSVGLG